MPVLSRQSVTIENVRVSNFDWDDQTQTVWATLSNQTCVHSPARPPLAIARRPIPAHNNHSRYPSPFLSQPVDASGGAGDRD